MTEWLLLTPCSSELNFGCSILGLDIEQYAPCLVVSCFATRSSFALTNYSCRGLFVIPQLIEPVRASSAWLQTDLSYT